MFVCNILFSFLYKLGIVVPCPAASQPNAFICSTKLLVDQKNGTPDLFSSKTNMPNPSMAALALVSSARGVNGPAVNMLSVKL